MSKVKSVFKVLVILLLVAAAIGGAVYIFYANFVRPANSNEELQKVIYSVDRANFNSKFATVDQLASDAGNNNLNLLIATTSNLDDILTTLSNYILMEDDNNPNITSSINALKSSLYSNNSNLDEYILKSNAAYFDKAKGANDIYLSVCDYIVNYSKMLNTLNEEIAKLDINTDADVKFSIIDLYLRVCVSTFKADAVVTNTNFAVVKEIANINFLNGVFELNNGYLTVVDGEGFSSNTTQFIAYYNSCNKQLFADELDATIASISSEIVESDTAETKAAFYLKKIYGV